MAATVLSIEEVGELATRVLDEVERAIVGKRDALELILLGILGDGHVLLEDYPGLAKTLIARSFAQATTLGFSRIQFTPDLMPSDVTGSSIFNQQTADFEFRPGPIFANILLSDEINRAPPKTQAALLEAMQERQVTIEGTTHPLERPFLVLATQNPIEYEGTYPLPEAQLDRFLLKVIVDYPRRDDEIKIVEQRARTGGLQQVRQVTSSAQLQKAIKLLDEIYIDERVTGYIVDVVRATREPASVKLPDLEPLIETGASPRASIALALAGRAHALLAGRAYVTPQDVKSVAHDVMRHRLILSYEAEAREVRPEDVITRVLDHVEVP